MTPEIIERVDAWLASRPGQHRWLSNDWRKACTLWRYRRAKDPGDASGAVASAQAAMMGLLLALVREAWGIARMHVESCDGIWILRRPSGTIGLIAGPQGTAFFAEAEALVAGLEAAPKTGGAA